MNNLLSQKWCLCLNVQNRIKLCCTKNHKFGDDTTICCLEKIKSLWAVHSSLRKDGGSSTSTYQIAAFRVVNALKFTL